MAKTATPPAPTKEAPPAPAPAPAEIAVRAPADNAVGNEFVNGLDAVFAASQAPSSNGAEPKPTPEPKVEPKTDPQPEPKKEEPAKEEPKVDETPDPLTELTSTKEPAKEEPAKEPEEAPETLPKEQKAADAAFAKLRHQEKENRRLLKESKDALIAKDKQIAELSAKGSGDLAKENETLKADLAARSKALAELDVRRDPEYVKRVTQPTDNIETYFKQVAEQAGVEFSDVMEATKEPNPLKRNAALQKFLSELTPMDQLTASQAANELQNVLATKDEFEKNAEVYQSEFKARREKEAAEAVDGYKTALAGAQEKLFPALQKSIPVLGDDNVFRAVKEGVTLDLSKNLTPDKLVGGIISLHAMPEMKRQLAETKKQLAEALERIKAGGNSEPNVDVGSREVPEGEMDFMAGLDRDARRQGARV